jgi:hypothetical protein
MKLYYHPASTTSRIVQLFALDQGVSLEYQMVDLMSGEHLKPEFVRINPNSLSGSPSYPNIERWLKNMRGLKSWGRVHEVFDQFAASLKDKSFVAI